MEFCFFLEVLKSHSHFNLPDHMWDTCFQDTDKCYHPLQSNFKKVACITLDVRVK